MKNNSLSGTFPINAKFILNSQGCDLDKGICANDPLTVPIACGELPRCTPDLSRNSKSETSLFVILVSESLVNLFLAPFSALVGMFAILVVTLVLDRFSLLQSALIASSVRGELPSAICGRSKIISFKGRIAMLAALFVYLIAFIPILLNTLLPLLLPSREAYVSAPSGFTGTFKLTDTSLPLWITPNMLTPPPNYPNDKLGIYGSTAGVLVANAAKTDKLIPATSEKELDSEYFNATAIYSEIEVRPIVGGTVKSADYLRYLGLGLFEIQFIKSVGSFKIIESRLSLAIPFVDVAEFSSVFFGDTSLNCPILDCKDAFNDCSCPSLSTLLRYDSLLTSQNFTRTTNFSGTLLSISGMWNLYIEVSSLSSPKNLVVNAMRCGSTKLVPSRAPYPVSVLDTNEIQSFCTSSTYNITVDVLYRDTKLTPSNSLLPLAFFTKSLDFTTESFESISMNDPRAYGVKFPQFVPMKNVLPLIVGIGILGSFLTILYLFFEDPSWIVAKRLLAVDERETLLSSTGKPIVLDGVEYVRKESQTGEKGLPVPPGIALDESEFQEREVSDYKSSVRRDQNRTIIQL